MILCTNSLLLLKSSGSKEHHETYTLYLLLYCYTFESPTHLFQKISSKQQFVKKQMFLPSIRMSDAIKAESFLNSMGKWKVCKKFK